MHPWLAIESATGPCSVALGDSGRVAAYLHEPRPSMQARLLVPMIEAALKEAGLAYADLAGIVTTVGPGSFTSVRIGLAAARAIAFAAHKPVQGITTLAAVAYPQRNAGGTLHAVLNAGKGEVYHQTFSANPFAPLTEPLIAPPEGLPAPMHPDARTLLHLLALPALFTPPEPLYIREPDAKLPPVILGRA